MGDVLHRLDAANFSGFIYTQVYTSASTVVVLNGTTTTIAPPMLLNIKVKTLTSASPTNVFLVGKAMPYDISRSNQIIL